MAADPFADRYRRYKAGTKKVVHWLTTAAKQCGNIVDLLACTSLCGSDVAQRDSTELSVKDLVRLAEAIAASKSPKIEIPLEILVITEDVIGGREACAGWYATTKSGSGGETEKQNKGHRNFIDALKRLLAVLKSKYEERLPKRLKQKPEKMRQMKEDLVQNIYEHLDIEQPTEAPLGSRRTKFPLTSAKSQNGQQSPTQNAPLLDVDETDKAFALWCFFKDQHDVCELLKEAWQEYTNGKLNFPTVCNVTDFAFILMKKASTSFTRDYPCFKDMQDINNYLGFGLSTLGGGLTILAYREKKVSSDVHSSPPLHELFCIKAACVMQDFRDMVCSQNRRCAYGGA